jgi:hypothetical protein
MCLYRVKKKTHRKQQQMSFCAHRCIMELLFLALVLQATQHYSFVVRTNVLCAIDALWNGFFEPLFFCKQRTIALGINYLFIGLFCLAEMVMPIGQNNIDDIFYSSPWNLTAFIQNCQQKYFLTPRPFWTITEFGGHDLAMSGAANIIFSNGDLDPWAGGGRN